MILTAIQVLGLATAAALWWGGRDGDPLKRSIANGVAMLVAACVGLSILLRLGSAWYPLFVLSWVCAVLPFAVGGGMFVAKSLG